MTPGPRLASGGSGPTSTLVVDVTGPGAKPDGIPDILVSNSASGDIGVLPGVGGGFFNDQFPLVIPLGDDRHTALDPVAIIAAGGGGVTVNFGSDNLTYIPNLEKPDGQVFLAAGGTGPVDAVLADVAGKPSLVVANEEDGSVVVLLGEADGFAGPQIISKSDALAHPTALLLAPSGDEVFVADSASASIARLALSISENPTPEPPGPNGPGQPVTTGPDAVGVFITLPLPLTEGTATFLPTLVTSPAGEDSAARASPASAALSGAAAAAAAASHALDEPNERADDGTPAANPDRASVPPRLFNFLSGLDETLRAPQVELEPAPNAGPAPPPEPGRDLQDDGYPDAADLRVPADGAAARRRQLDRIFAADADAPAAGPFLGADVELFAGFDSAPGGVLPAGGGPHAPTSSSDGFAAATVKLTRQPPCWDEALALAALAQAAYTSFLAAPVSAAWEPIDVKLRRVSK